MNCKMTVKLYDEYDLEIEVIGTFEPEEAPVFYLKNGDPGYPGSDAEFYIETIKVNGTLIDDVYGKIADSLYEDVLQKAIDQYNDQPDIDDGWEPEND